MPAHQRLGDFKIIRFLGKGGMGEVYEAQQDRPARRVALKVLPSELASSRQAVERFHRESDLLARVNHPGIVPVYTGGRTDQGVVYFAMQLVRGVSLAQLIKDTPSAGVPPPGEAIVSAADTPLAGSDLETLAYPDEGAAIGTPPGVLRAFADDRWNFVARVGVALADGLHAAHQEQVLHRDVKPSNVMIDWRGHVYLLDFGLALLLDAVEGTQPGLLRGTPWYMSPEQALAEPLDARSDVFSLGVTLYELATGGIGPYPADRFDHEAVLREVRQGRIAPLEELVPAIPPGLARILEMAIRFEPGARHQTAAAFRDDLAAWQRDAAFQPAPPRPPPAPRPKPAGWASYLPAAGLLLVLVVLLAAGLALSGRWRETGTEGPFPAWTAWPDHPLPAERQVRDTLRRVPLPLFTRDPVKPIWSVKLRGEPNWMQPMREHLVVASARVAKADLSPTMVLLDYDPDGNWYELDVKLQAAGTDQPGRHEVGVFFGYRRVPQDPGRFFPCLAVRLTEFKESVGDVKAMIHVGWMYFEEPNGTPQPRLRQFQKFPPPHDQLALPVAPKDAKGWRRLRIRALDDVVAITIDGTPPLRIDLSAIRSLPLSPDLAELDPRGGLGLWVHNGMGSYADASVTPLASQRLGR